MNAAPPAEERPPETRKRGIRNLLQDALRSGAQGLRGRPQGRDIIAAEIGDRPQGVAVGKNIIQIGTFVIPTLPVAALLLVALAGLGLSAWRTFAPALARGPARMQGGFNVAIASFSRLDASGRAGRSPEGERLSAWVFDAFQAEKDSRPDLKAAVQVWHDSLPASQKGFQIGFMPGDSSEARAAAAARTAADIGADVLIYGSLDPQGRLTPEFYVSPSLKAGADIHGHFLLGTEPIPVDLSAGLAVNRQLTARSLALFWLTIGLSYERAGLSGEALAAFRQAESLADWRGAGQGREVLYFFIGQAALFAGKDAEAEDAFRQAFDADRSYAGALLGLGSVHFARAQTLQPASLRLETPDLEQALENYAAALQLAPGSPDRAWATYAAPLALGMAYRLQGDAYLSAGNLPAASSAFDAATSQIQGTLEPMAAAKEYRMLGQAYQALGTAYAQKADVTRRQGDAAQARGLYQAARQAYVKCIDQAAAAPLDEILTRTIVDGLCRPYDQAAANALQELGAQ